MRHVALAALKGGEEAHAKRGGVGGVGGGTTQVLRAAGWGWREAAAVCAPVAAAAAAMRGFWVWAPERISGGEAGAIEVNDSGNHSNAGFVTDRVCSVGCPRPAWTAQTTVPGAPRPSRRRLHSV